MTSIMVHIGERLKMARLRATMTQRELAARAGVAQHTIARLETNTTEPRPHTIRKLAEALGVEPRELLGD